MFLKVDFCGADTHTVLPLDQTPGAPEGSLKLLEFRTDHLIHVGTKHVPYQPRHQHCTHLTVEKTEAQRTAGTCLRLHSMSMAQQGLLAPNTPLSAPTLPAYQLVPGLENLAGLVGWAQRYHGFSVGPERGDWRERATTIPECFAF